MAGATIHGRDRQAARQNRDLLELDYDLNSLGLGSGQVGLTRVCELEIADCNCRDYAARAEAKHQAISWLHAGLAAA